MTITLTTTEPQAAHEVLDIIGAIGVARRQIFSSGPLLGDALDACKGFLREKAAALGADAVVAIRFETHHNNDAIDVTAFGTAVRWR